MTKRAVAAILKRRAVLSCGAGIRYHEGPDGRHVIADFPQPSFAGQFHVYRASVNEVVVSLGLINGLVPTLAGIPIDGRVKGKQQPVPMLKLTKPNEDLQSWVCVQVTVDLKTGLVDPQNKDAYTIVHRSDRVPRSNGLVLDDGHGSGLCELALVIWSDKTSPLRLIQNIYFAQTHSFKAATEKAGQAVHFFSSAS